MQRGFAHGKKNLNGKSLKLGCLCHGTVIHLYIRNSIFK